MERKTASYPLLDGKDYVFSERNREDINYTALQNKYRRHRIKELKETFPDKQDLELRDALIMQEWGKMYVNTEVWQFIADDPEEKLNLVYASFKVNNADISLDQFKKLADAKTVDYLLRCINELEQEDPALDDEVIKELKVDRKLFISWKKSNPEVYWAIKRELKKKVAPK